MPRIKPVAAGWEARTLSTVLCCPPSCNQGLLDLIDGREEFRRFVFHVDSCRIFKQTSVGPGELNFGQRSIWWENVESKIHTSWAEFTHSKKTEGNFQLKLWEVMTGWNFTLNLSLIKFTPGKGISIFLRVTVGWTVLKASRVDRTYLVLVSGKLVLSNKGCNLSDCR